MLTGLRTSLTALTSYNIGITPVVTFVRTFAKGAMKTNKSAAKRFRIKGNGDLKRSVFIDDMISKDNVFGCSGSDSFTLFKNLL